MNKDQALGRINFLSEEIEKHNHLYYVVNQPEISDYDFDVLLKELEALEAQFPEFASEHSPTKRVGGDITRKFETVVHRFPMLSLSNTYSEEEIQDWENRIKKSIDEKVEYVCELKYDGVAIGIRYQNGLLTRAVTRGDGTQGEDVTNNVKTIRSVPLKLKGDFPEDFEIRGEIFMPLTRFLKLNAEREENGEQLFANPRNTAAGTLKMQDSKIVAERGLDSYLYGFYAETNPFKGHFEAVETALDWGFKAPTPKNRLIEKTDSIAGIMDFIHYWDKHRDDLPFEIDGVVIKVNDYGIQKKLGFTAKSPRWAIAFKFKTERVETQLESVTYQVGRTGAITPVANLKPVQLGGTTVKRASLHNADQIEKLDLHESDYVYVEKGGEIIPKIVGVNLEKRQPIAGKLIYISACPECGSELIRREGEAQHFCPNEKGCSPQIKGRIEHFISRKAMNIEGLGAETVDMLVERNMISNYADLYELTYDQVLQMDRMAEKSAENLISGINASRDVPFERVLFALGIRYVGETVAKKLAKYFKNMDALMSASYDDLVAVDEIGERIAISIQQFFLDDYNKGLVERLRSYGLQFELKEKEGASNVLEGKTFVVSGVFNAFSREEIKEVIEMNGGKNVSSVSSKTDYLLAGDGMGPSKLKKATDLGVKILSEDEFIKMIG
ncbi:MAG: NAD-dependent DNA ligase LigA [Bacteroidetes bacterium]|nr:MAG: NAD-dependent DNA ligase LigA [Bacteroidota bacterium]